MRAIGRDLQRRRWPEVAGNGQILPLKVWYRDFLKIAALRLWSSGPPRELRLVSRPEYHVK